MQEIYILVTKLYFTGEYVEGLSPLDRKMMLMYHEQEKEEERKRKKNQPDGIPLGGIIGEQYD